MKKEPRMDTNKHELNPFLGKLLHGVTVEWKTLGEVGEFRRGTAITKKQTTSGNIPVIANGPLPTYFHSEMNREGETIVIARSGYYAGYISFWNEPIFLTDAFSIHPDPEILKSKFVYYMLQNKQTQIHEMKKGAGVPHVRVTEFQSYIIPIPSLAEQTRIVADFLRAVLQRKLHEFYLHLAPSEDLIPAKSPAKQRTKH